MNLKKSKISAQMGGLTYLNMTEVDINRRFINKRVAIIDVLNNNADKLKFAFEKEGANVLVLKEYELLEAISDSTLLFDIFINIADVIWDNYSSVTDLEQQFNKQLFLVCQAEKEYLLSKHHPGKILNITNVTQANNDLSLIVYEGQIRLTKGLAKSMACGYNTANMIIADDIKKSLQAISDTALFLASDFANDILGQIIKVK